MIIRIIVVLSTTNENEIRDPITVQISKRMVANITAGFESFSQLKTAISLPKQNIECFVQTTVNHTVDIAVTVEIRCPYIPECPWVLHLEKKLQRGVENMGLEDLGEKHEEENTEKESDRRKPSSTIESAHGAPHSGERCSARMPQEILFRIVQLNRKAKENCQRFRNGGSGRMVGPGKQNPPHQLIVAVRRKVDSRLAGVLDDHHQVLGTVRSGAVHLHHVVVVVDDLEHFANG